MKPSFIYLTSSFLLMICYIEKQHASAEANIQHTASDARFFVGRFTAAQQTTDAFQMQLQIKDSFLKGWYRPANSTMEVELIGALSTQNELVLIETANGITTGTFKGRLEDGGDRMLRLAGVWTSVDNDHVRPFLIDEVQQLAPATSLASKK